MNCKLTSIVTSLCVSPALLFSAMKQQPKQAAPEEPTMCDETSPRTQRIEFKHIEAKGVGYRQGYSTLEGFFTVPSTLDGSWVPFLDIRGHIFNDGKPAVNGGMGLRYLTDYRVWGLNTYYDYRKTNRFHYNQVGFGFETLGKIWDFRLNAYVPVGKKDSHIFNTHFHEFKGNSIILSSKKEIAMKGANAEAAAHVLRKENYKLYVAAGPYYFEHEGRVAWGGEGRIALTLFDILRLQVSGSGDKVFHGIVQGEAALVYSFGGKRTIKPRKNNNDCYCADRAMVEERALQRVDRNEIVVVTKKHHKAKAVNPDTGHAYKVWFVDNTSHSQGTFESPFNNLIDAQNSSGPNDIIYVFPGDGTDTGMNMGIALKNGQQLLGAGIGQYVDTTRGTMHIPAHAKGLPLITNTFATDTIGRTCVALIEGNNVVSGFNLFDTLKTGTSGADFTTGLRIWGGLNYLIKNNIISSGANASPILEGGNPCNIYGGGNVTFANNTFVGVDNVNDSYGIDIFAFIAPLKGFFVFENNLFTGANANSGLTQGIHFEPRTAGVFGSIGVIGDLRLSAMGNTFNSQSNTAYDDHAGIEVIDATASTVTVNIKNNNFITPAGIAINPGTTTTGVLLFNSGPGLLTADLQNNVSLTIPPTFGYVFENATGNPALFQLDFGSDNVGTRSGP